MDKNRTSTNTIEHRNYKKLMQIAPGILEDRYRYMKLRSEPFMDLIIEKLDDNRISMAHYFLQNGDLMSDPDMEIIVDRNQEKVKAATYQLDCMAFYQEAYNADNQLRDVRKAKVLNDFLEEWLKNIIDQGHVTVKAHYLDEEKGAGGTEPVFDERGNEKEPNVPIYSYTEETTTEYLEEDEDLEI